MNTEVQAELRSFDEDDEWDDDAAERTFLIFELASERYAIPVRNVSEILRVPDIALVPDTPPYICGTVNLRGGVVPVVDLRLRFGLPSVQRNNRQVLILVEEDEELAALLVDTVKDAVEIHDEQIDASMRSEGTNRFVRGLARRSEGGAMEIVLSVAALLGIKSAGL